MTNKKLLEKLQEDMEMRGFSHYTKDSYYRKAKEIVEYFGKPMSQVTTKELREFLMKYIREEKRISERSCNYYNSVIRFIYDVVLDKPINHKQIPMYKKKRRLPKILSEKELDIFFNKTKRDVSKKYLIVQSRKKGSYEQEKTCSLLFLQNAISLY